MRPVAGQGDRGLRVRQGRRGLLRGVARRQAGAGGRALGLTFAGEPAARITALTGAKRGASDTTWEQPWGEQRTIRDNHSELTVSLAGDTPLSKTFDVTFRLFDDGLGFRYAYGAIPAGQNVAVTDERTAFEARRRL